MSELYLVAHLVRGEPAFDIASQISTDSETIWIIPTSGHRAWPYWSVPIEDIQFNCGFGYGDEVSWDVLHQLVPDPPSDHPDHYSTHTTKGPFLTNLASALGFKREEVKRRV